MTVKLKKYQVDGKQSGDVEVSDEAFAVEPNIHVMHLAVRRELANGRPAVASAKTRSEVRGGGKKPWKQKGTGRARAGSSRSPLWVGGGVIFGPKPRDFSFAMPKKVRRLAAKSALSASKEKFHVVEDFSFLAEPKAKVLAKFLKDLNLEGKEILVLAHYKAEENKHLFLSARNHKSVKVSLPHNLSVKDLLHADAVVMTQAAVQELNERYAADV